MSTLSIGAVRATRVVYAEVDLPAETFGLTGDEVRAAAAAWLIESGDARIVVDPALAADEILRTEADAGAHQQAFAALLDAAGFPRETITHAVATHYDGVGMLAWRNDDGSWCRFFPNAPVLISARELAAIDISNRLDDSCVQPTGDRHPITSEVTLEHTGAHTPGHQIVRIESEGERAVIVGHLAVVPHHLSSGVIPKQHVDAEAAWTTLCALRDEDTVLIGPLWPTPGAGRWQNGELVPV